MCQSLVRLIQSRREITVRAENLLIDVNWLGILFRVRHWIELVFESSEYFTLHLPPRTSYIHTYMPVAYVPTVIFENSKPKQYLASVIGF